MKIAALLPLVLPLAAAPALASSPDAWRAHDAQVRSACIKASGLRTARASAPAPFSDDVGRTAALVTGVWPQAHMKGRRGTFLCLFDRRSGTAEAVEAAGWSAPTR